MVLFLLLLLLIIAFLPLIFTKHKKIVNKKLFFWSFIFITLQPIGTILIPSLFSLETFERPGMITYLVLINLYYFVIFLAFYFFIKILSINKNQNHNTFLKKPSKFAKIFFLFALFFFTILVIHSGGVFLTNPRYGYQYFRRGIGFVWVFYIFMVGITYYFLMIKRKPNSLKVLFFVILMFFTGSKKLILDVFLKSYLTYLYHGIKLKKWQIILAIIILILGMLKLFGQFGAQQDLIVRMAAYFDFMRNASRAFEDYANGTLPCTCGTITLSDFWTYVPRAIYPDKPVAFGHSWLVGYYYPHLAASGHYPSFGILTHEFVDFRWFAPIATLLLNPYKLLQILSLVILATNANVNKNLKTLSLAFILIPGFGFHLPLPITFLFAFFILPKLTIRNNANAI